MKLSKKAKTIAIALLLMLGIGAIGAATINSVQHNKTVIADPAGN